MQQGPSVLPSSSDSTKTFITADPKQDGSSSRAAEVSETPTCYRLLKHLWGREGF